MIPNWLLIAVLVAITYGIQPYGGHSMGWTNPLVLAEMGSGLGLLALFVAIELRIDGPMAHITLNRPDKLNAISAQMVAELHGALDESERSAQVRVITLRGAGRAFCSGFDLGELEADAAEPQMRRVLESDFEIIMRFWRSPKPTICPSITRHC